MKTISFFIAGKPEPKARPRVVMNKGKVHGITPIKTKNWEEFIKFQAITHRPYKLIDGPIKITCSFYLARPKTLPKKIIYHQKKPDIDNLYKSVADALEGIFYYNDSQIYKANIEKHYINNTIPGVFITLEYEA